MSFFAKCLNRGLYVPPLFFSFLPPPPFFFLLESWESGEGRDGRILEPIKKRWAGSWKRVCGWRLRDSNRITLFQGESLSYTTEYGPDIILIKNSLILCIPCDRHHAKKFLYIFKFFYLIFTSILQNRYYSLHYTSGKIKAYWD